MRPKISYHPVEEFPGWNEMQGFVCELVRSLGVGRVLEIGAGANPTLSSELADDLKIEYTISDGDPNELAVSVGGYQRLLLDICAPRPNLQSTFDLVFSRMVAEHLPDGRLFHRNVADLLVPSGYAVHCFSTLYAFPFFMASILPERLSDSVLDLVVGSCTDRHHHFTTSYSWCRGPTKTMIRRLEGIGYRIVEYRGYFGHHYYSRIGFVDALEHAKKRLFLRRPVAHLTSYSVVILQKRGPAEAVS